MAKTSSFISGREKSIFINPLWRVKIDLDSWKNKVKYLCSAGLQFYMFGWISACQARDLKVLDCDK